MTPGTIAHPLFLSLSTFFFHQVVLEAPDADALTSLAHALASSGANVKLWIEQPEGVPTALAAGPARKSTLAPLLKKLPLCRAAIGGK